jgi:hypothetical protein
MDVATMDANDFDVIECPNCGGTDLEISVVTQQDADN